jgi:hypothetical protein
MSNPSQAQTLTFTAHALNMLSERNIERAWVEAALDQPDWTEMDPSPDRHRAFKAVPEARSRILRVVYVDAPEEIRVITAFFDRNAKKP